LRLVLSKAKEKRPLFPEDVIDPNVHTSLLFFRQPSNLNKKPFIHIRDEEFTPRYHPDSVEKFEGYKLQVSLQHSTFQLSNALCCCNGLTRR
jgi:hypothetical protein